MNAYGRFDASKLVVSIVLLTIFAAGGRVHASLQTLDVFTWTEYVSPDLVAAFEKQHNAKVNFHYFKNDEEREEMLVKKKGRGYDVVLLDGSMVSVYLQIGWLEEITVEKVPTLSQIDERFLTAFSHSKGYVLPYFWGTAGIAYRVDKVPYPMKSWKDLFEPHDDMIGKFSLFDSVDPLIRLTMKVLGYSINSTDRNQHAEVEQYLLNNRKKYRGFETPVITEDSELLTGTVYAGMLYGGDTLVLSDFNPNVKYVVPKEGTLLWLDVWGVLTSAANKELGYTFINFLNEPKNAAVNAEYLRYPTPNVEAKKLISAESLENEAIYPSEEILKKSEFAAELPPIITQQRMNIYNRVVNE